MSSDADADSSGFKSPLEYHVTITNRPLPDTSLDYEQSAQPDLLEESPSNVDRDGFKTPTGDWSEEALPTNESQYGTNHITLPQ